MVKLTTMLLMMFLGLGASSCGTIARKIMCEEIELYTIKPLRTCDVSFSPIARCRCRCLDFNSWTSLPMNHCPEFKDFGEIESFNFDVKYCEGIAGFYLSDHVVEIRPKVTALSDIKNRMCP